MFDYKFKTHAVLVVNEKNQLNADPTDLAILEKFKISLADVLNNVMCAAIVSVRIETAPFRKPCHYVRIQPLV